MASGSEDYWLTQSRLIANILESLVVSLSDNGDLYTKLDALDGTMDGVLKLADISDDIASTLAYLTGIETSVETGGDLINKLDNLDGKADGKLDLNALKTMDVFYDGVAEKSRLELALDDFATQITKLTSVVTAVENTATLMAAIKAATVFVSEFAFKYQDGAVLVATAWSARMNTSLAADSGNADNIYIGYADTVTPESYEYYITPGQTVNDHAVSTIYAHADELSDEDLTVTES